MTTTKQCIDCKQMFPATTEYFSSDKQKRDGLCSYCKACRSKRRKTEHIDHAEANRKRAHEWFCANRERARASRKSRYRKNRDNAVRYNADWQRKHPDLLKANKRRYYQSHKADYKRYSVTRTARKKSAEGTFTIDDIERQYQAQEGRCAYCGIPLNGKYEIDHVIPLSRGGSNYPDNLACACRRCNRSKGDKLLSEWLHRTK